MFYSIPFTASQIGVYLSSTRGSVASLCFLKNKKKKQREEKVPVELKMHTCSAET